MNTQEAALYLLNNERDLRRNIEHIYAQRGLATGLGFPSREQIECRLAKVRAPAPTEIDLNMRIKIVDGDATPTGLMGDPTTPGTTWRTCPS